MRALICKRTLRAPTGFSGVEVLLVLALLSLLCAALVPGYLEGQRRSRTAAALLDLNRMYDGALSYWSADHHDEGGTLLPRQFPDPLAGWVPERGQCCKHDDGLCPVRDTDGPIFEALRFTPKGPGAFSYDTRSSTGETAGSEIGDWLAVLVGHDPACDGHFLAFGRHLFVGPGLSPRGTEVWSTFSEYAP